MATRAETRRQARDEKITERGLKHYKTHLGEAPPKNPRVPKTKEEMQYHMAGKHTHLFREPMTRKEKREWDKFWTLKGKGITK